MSMPNRSVRTALRSEPGVMKVHKVRPRRRTCVAARITESSIRRIADIIDEIVYRDVNSNSRMSDGDTSVPTGWWIVWHGDSPQDYHLYSDEDFETLYKVHKRLPRVVSYDDVREGDVYVARYPNGEWTAPSRGPVAVTRDAVDRIILLEEAS